MSGFDRQRDRTKPFPWRLGAMLLGTAVLAAACRRGEEQRPRTELPPPRTERVSHASIEAVLTVDPGVVMLDRDVLLTLQIDAPTDLPVTIPPIDDRLQGFLLNGVYDEEPITTDGRTRHVRHARLTPVIADSYRLAPMAIRYGHAGSGSDTSQPWFATPAIRFELRSPYDAPPANEIRTNLEPHWIRPPARVLLLWVLAVLAAVVLGFALWKAAAHIRRETRLRKLSPRARALGELDELLKKDLTGKHRYKDFYIELTMIVRRYIERQHAVRAPEQTTEEFLVAVSRNPHFHADVVARLKAFLEAADLVKFAAYRPGNEAVVAATQTARRYIETDSEDDTQPEDSPDV